MRTLPFREVLHSVADKMGLDPEQSNFLTNQAVPIGKSIDQWIRRTYDSVDFPEWTRTIPVHVNSDHMVSYDPLVSGQVNDIPIHIYRVLNVYLVDPATTDAPVETDFTLMPEGIHVGFDHGTTVWIKYIEPAPRYTAEQWQADQAYAKDDVTYSYTTGEVYKSKVNGNIGHDPSGTFQPPPNVDIIQPPVPLTTEITQQVSQNDPGIVVQPKIIDAYLITSISNIPPNIPPNLSQFYIPILNPDGSLLASAVENGDGIKTLATITTNLRNTLAGIGALSGFTITADTVNFKIRFSSQSDYYLIRPQGGNAPFYAPDGGPIYYLPAVQVQAYVPALAGSAGSPQIIQLTLSESSVVPGATYGLTFKDLAGVEHSVSYVALDSDNSNNILSGLIAQLSTAQATDAFFKDITPTLNTTDSTVTFSMMQAIGLNAEMLLPGSPWWELVPFPRTIANTVIRGAYADLLKEWGQADKGAGEEQAVPSETTIAAGKFQGTPSTGLTDQQQPLSRYRIQ